MRGNAAATSAKHKRATGPRWPLRALEATAVAACLALGAGTGAMAESAQGPGGQTITVSKASGLNAAGETVTVSGSGFDLSKGIYLGVCVNNGAGAVPTPCLGGVDMTGGSGSSVWISSNPPAYGQGLAQPYTESGGKGSFSVGLAVTAADTLTDCQDKAKAPNGCVIVTRADHTRSADRTADVMIPISFGTVAAADAGAAGQPAQASAGASAKADAKTGALAKTGATTGIYLAGGAVLLAAGAGALIITRRRKAGN